MNVKNLRNIGVFWIMAMCFSGYYVLLALLIELDVRSRIISIVYRILHGLLIVGFLANSPLKKNLYSTIFLVFSILYIMKTLYSGAAFPSHVYSQGIFNYIAYYILFSLLPFFAFFNLEISTKAMLIIERALVNSGILLVVLCLILYRDLISSGIGRLSESIYLYNGRQTLNPLSLAYSSSLGASLVINRLILRRGRSRILILLDLFLVLLAFYGVLLGSSKGALICLVLCTLISIFSSRQFFSFTTALTVAVMIIAAPKILALSGSNILERFSSVGSANSSHERLTYYQDSFAEFLKYPIFGGRIEVSGIYPHNIILESLMSTGLVGTLLLIILMTTVIARLVKIRSKGINIVTIVVIHGFVMLMVSDSLWSGILMYVALGLGLNPTLEKFIFYECKV